MLDAEQRVGLRRGFERLRPLLLDHHGRNRAVDLRDLLARQVLARRVPHHPGDRRSPVRGHIEHLELLAVAQIEAAKPVGLAEFLHLSRGERHQLVDGKIELRAADNGLAVGGDLQDHELVAAAGADGSQPVRLAEIEKLRPGRGDVLEHRNGLDVDRRSECERFGLPAIVEARAWRSRNRRRRGDCGLAAAGWTAAASVRLVRAGESRC